MALVVCGKHFFSVLFILPEIEIACGISVSDREDFGITTIGFDLSKIKDCQISKL